VNEVALELLRANASHAAAFDARFDGLENYQQPDVVTVCCSDSRVLQDHIWENHDPGNIFTCSNIGNRVVQRTDGDEVVSGDVVYPLSQTDTKVAIVVGHTGCGAVTATYDSLTDGIDESPGIEHCLSLLEPPLAPGVERLPNKLDRHDAINHLVEYNVDRQVDALLDSDDVPDDVTVLGVVYDFQRAYDGRRGEVHVVNVDGERNASELISTHPKIADRVGRRWAY